jgi:hypothetical protein
MALHEGLLSSSRCAAGAPTTCLKLPGQCATPAGPASADQMSYAKCGCRNPRLAFWDPAAAAQHASCQHNLGRYHDIEQQQLVTMPLSRSHVQAVVARV